MAAAACAHVLLEAVALVPWCRTKVGNLIALGANT